MTQTLATEIADHLSRMCRVALALLMVAIVWLFLPATSIAAEAPPSVLILPPRLPADAGDAVRAAADAACDRLAQEIAAGGFAQVVDRTQLDRILQERNLQTGTPRPMLSYDAMIRLQADTTRLAPQTQLSLIDLSAGNIIAQHSFAWPPNEADATPMLDFCRDSLKRVAAPAVGKLRVRALWAAEAIDNERIRPLGQRLIDLFDQSLRRSERVLLVRHLEAATSKEESLLLLFGLSRLPGGREFTPQADATVELRVVEGDGRGKTFPETPVEIGVRLRKGADYQGDWVATTGLIRDFDVLIPQAWQKLAQSLAGLQPETATALLNEMSLRRKQAQAELQAAEKVEKGGVRQADPHRGEALAAALAHTEAALKLDPTYSDAVCAHIEALRGVAFEQLREMGRHPEQGPRAPSHAVREIGRFLEQFRRDAAVCSHLCSGGAFCLQCSPLQRLYGLSWSDTPPEPVTKSTVALTPECVQDLDAAKQLLERGIEDDVIFRYGDAYQMMAVAYHGMKLLDVPAVERQAWLDRIGCRCRDKIKRGVMDKTFPDCDWNEYVGLQFHRAELMMEDGQVARAKEIIAQVQPEIPAWCMPWPSVVELMRTVIAKTGNARLAADFQGWIKRGEKASVHLIYMRWPTVNALGGHNIFAPGYYLDNACPRLNSVVVGVDPYVRCRPLAEGDGRLYFLMPHPQNTIAYVPVDRRGRPIGHAVPNAHGAAIWDNVKSMPQPKFGYWSHNVSARYIDGRLYLGSGSPFPGASGVGLSVFDPKTETWKNYGPEQGLPASAVDAFFPIGGQMLYCACNAGHYTLNLATGAVTLVHRGDEQAGRLINNDLHLLWRDGERLMAVSRSGILGDLLSAAPKHVALSNQTCYGWWSDDMHLGIISAAEAAGRRFYFCRGGLYEIDAAGNTLRAWWAGYGLYPAGGGLRVNTGLEIFTPADCPIAGLPTLYGVGQRLVLSDCNRAAEIYDTASDTWYDGVCCDLATPSGGLWTTQFSDGSLHYLSIDDVMDYAKAAGRVMTTTEYRRRKQQFIDAAQPLDRAKLNLGMHRFDQAKAALRQVLDAEPNQPDALILMGFLHDRSCLNRPDEAIEYYRRAAALEDDPIASYSGMYLWVCVLKNRRQWKETVDLCEKILQRYPGLGEHERQDSEWLRDYGRRQLAKKDAKQPAAATSNKVERPAK